MNIVNGSFVELLCPSKWILSFFSIWYISSKQISENWMNLKHFKDFKSWDISWDNILLTSCSVALLSVIKHEKEFLKIDLSLVIHNINKISFVALALVFLSITHFFHSSSQNFLPCTYLNSITRCPFWSCINITTV